MNDYSWTDKEIEVWIEKRFGPNSGFNRQLVRDLTNEAINRISPLIESEEAHYHTYDYSLKTNSRA